MGSNFDDVVATSLRGAMVAAPYDRIVTTSCEVLALDAGSSRPDDGDLPMLDLRPCCEHCAKDLPPDSTDAMICSYECTFCRSCVESVLANVCPNCGGGFERRPARVARAHRDGVSLAHHPAATTRRHRPVDPATHAAFAAPLRHVPPHAR